jgi:FAD/FMN-containing dehydrogenase
MVFLLALLLHAAELMLTGHAWVAAGTTVLALGAWAAGRQLTPHRPGSPRRLLLAADGRLHVLGIGGNVQQLALGAASLWLGSAVLLELRAPRQTFRVLVGRGNLDPATLAALRRRLRGAAAAARHPAVDWPLR